MPLTSDARVSSLSPVEFFPAIGVLERAECERLLQRNMVGRLAFALHDHVGIVPVHYVYDEGWIYGRTEPQGKLIPILRNRRVAFEVDEHESMFTWQSVVAQGALYLIDADNKEQKEVYGNALRLLRRILPTTLATGDPVPFRNQLFRIQLSEMTGRFAAPGGRRIEPRQEPMRDAAATPEADALLGAAVIGAIAQAAPGSAARIQVDAFDGVVILSGMAETPAERRAIEAAVLGSNEVKAHVQQIETAFPSQEKLSPAELARAALRDLSPILTTIPDVKIVVEHDWVRVEGRVDNAGQRDEVLRYLRGLRGARGVIDRLDIRDAKESTR